MVKMTQGFHGGSGRIKWDPSDKVEIGNRRRVPREMLAHIRGGNNEPDLLLRIEVRDGVPQYSEVTFRSRPDGPEVRDKHLAALRLTDWLEEIVASVSSVAQPGSGWAKPVADVTAKRDVRRVLASRPRTVTPELLQRVAETYRAHVNDRPTVAVQRAFQVSHRTAARYVRQARDDGYLPPTQPGRKQA